VPRKSSHSAEAFAEDGSEIVVYDVERGEIDAGGGVGVGGNDQLDLGAFGYRAGPAHVDNCFRLRRRKGLGRGHQE